ncbi:Rieske (2Fe-2S) protein [Marinobacter sp. X15-166B]|uniref:Rieske (2Fe-2S) protein n=1 Tax=Marinobacter sp. X15-166B TaxID=1897620 RepID=UPI00085C9EBB|nr:Rieske 2Fe-2S domain-containing protein [Marinobacter sp. X15-166B]OEY66518.1 hypothetical protein BG841_08645 [Marinobacter sp. X15-166B]
MGAGHAWQRVCRVDDLQRSGAIEFNLDGTACFVISLNGLIAAYVNRCPHLGIELNWMPGRFFDLERTFIQCATHGALFTPDRGTCIAGPCQGDALSPLEWTLADGAVLVRMPV